jgi:hypothetical protein
LRRQRAAIDVVPLVDTTEDWPCLNLSLLDPLLQRLDRPTDQNSMRLVFRRGRLGTAEVDGKAGKERGGSIPRIGVHWLLVDKILDPKVGDFRAPAAAGGKGGQQKRPIANIDQPIAGTGS